MQDVSHHGSTARLGPYGLHLERAVGLAYIEQWMDDLHLLHHPPPVEQVLVFFGGEMDEDAVVGLDALDERVGEFVFL